MTRLYLPINQFGAAIAEGAHWLVLALESIWDLDGFSEFASAALGGGMTLWAQRWALKHDREKEQARRDDEKHAVAWAIYFKLARIFNLLFLLQDNFDNARRRCGSEAEFWMYYTPQAQDYEVPPPDIRELTFFVENSEFDLLNRYINIIDVLDHVTPLIRIYREVRHEVISKTLHRSETGASYFCVSGEPPMPAYITQLESLARNIEITITTWLPRSKAMLHDYGIAMKKAVGHGPKYSFRSDEERPNGDPMR